MSVPRRKKIKKTASAAKPRRAPILDLSDPKTIDWFRGALAAFEKRYARDPEAAEALRKREGIWTKSGKLTKAYRT